MEKQHESYEVGRYTNETKQEKHAQFSQLKFEHTLAQEYGKIKLIETQGAWDLYKRGLSTPCFVCQ